MKNNLRFVIIEKLPTSSQIRKKCCQDGLSLEEWRQASEHCKHLNRTIIKVENRYYSRHMSMCEDCNGVELLKN